MILWWILSSLLTTELYLANSAPSADFELWASSEYDGKLAIGRLNVDEHGELASQYSIVSIPSLLLFKNGEEVTQHIGAAPKETIVKFFEPHLD